MKDSFLLIVVVILITVHRSSQDEAQSCRTNVDNTEGISSSCAKQLKVLCDRKDFLFTLWDSSSRLLRTGLTATTALDLGNYDECLGLDEEVINEENERITVKGKYCSSSWQAALPKKSLEELVFRLEIQKTSLFHQNNSILIEAGDDASDLIGLSGTLCLPDACKVDEFTKIFNPYPFRVSFIENDEKCLLKDRGSLSTWELIITIFLGLIVAAMIISTCIHLFMHYLRKREPHDFIKAYSMFYNGKKLFTIIPKRSDQISCLYGIRFLCMCWVVCGHTFAGFQLPPQFNKQDVIDWQNALYSQYVITARYAVDTFFFLSGFLNAYLYLKMSKESSVSQQIKGIPLVYLHRYLRLTPAVAALFFVTISFLKFMSDGPLWYSIYNNSKDTCQENWWSFFLYIQNYFPENRICWLQTWYLSADMQMFILAPIVLIPMTIYVKKSIRLVISALGVLAVICIGISISIYYIVDDYSNRFDTHSRLSDYLVGMIGGVIMYRNRGKHVTIDKRLNVGLWILAICTMLFISLYMHDVNVNPTTLKKSLFLEISRPVWCLCIMWIVFSCYFGYGGFVNAFFSNPFFEVGSRLTYCIYIIHNTMIMIAIGQIRDPFYFSDYHVYYYFCGHMVTCFFLSIFWTMAFEGPMIVLDRMLFSWINSLGASKKEDKDKEVA